MNQNYLRGLSSWGKFLGWTILITGVLNAIVGVFAFVVGAIPGVISIFMGWKLISASKSAEMLSINPDERALNEMLKNYLTYFKIQGILLIISAVVFSIVGIGFFATLSHAIHH